MAEDVILTNALKKELDNVTRVTVLEGAARLCEWARPATQDQVALANKLASGFTLQHSNTVPNIDVAMVAEGRCGQRWCFNVAEMFQNCKPAVNIDHLFLFKIKF